MNVPDVLVPLMLSESYVIEVIPVEAVYVPVDGKLLNVNMVDALAAGKRQLTAISSVKLFVTSLIIALSNGDRTTKDSIKTNKIFTHARLEVLVRYAAESLSLPIRTLKLGFRPASMLAAASRHSANRAKGDGSGVATVSVADATSIGLIPPPVAVVVSIPKF